MKNKGHSIFVLIICLIFFNTIVYANDNMKNINYNGYDMGNIALYEYGEFYIPVRSFFNEIHYNVHYDKTNKDIIIYDNKDIVKVNKRWELTKNNQVVDIDTRIISKNGVTYIPLKILSEVFNFTVAYDREKIYIKGVNMYKIDNTYEKKGVYVQQINIYKKDRIIDSYSIPVIYDKWIKDYSIKKEIDITDYNVYANETVKIKEVFRTKNNNDIIDFYKYNGKNMFPYLTTFVYSYDNEKIKGRYSNIGLVYASLEMIVPNDEDIDYFSKSISERNNINEGIFAFIDTSDGLYTREIKEQFYVTTDEILADDKNGFYSDVRITPYNANYDLNAHKVTDIITRIDSLTLDEVKYTVRTINDKNKDEHLGTIYFNEPDGLGHEYTEVIQR